MRSTQRTFMFYNLLYLYSFEIISVPTPEPSTPEQTFPTLFFLGSTNVKRVHAVYDDDKFIFVKDNRDKYQYVFKAKPENLKTTSNKIKIIKDTAVPIFSRSDERDDNLNQHFSPQINIHNRKIKRIPRKKIHHALIVPFPDKHGKAVFKEEENYRGEQKIIKNINEDTFSL